MSKEKKFYEAMESDIMNADIPDSKKNKLMKNFLQLKEQKINLMITGYVLRGVFLVQQRLDHIGLFQRIQKSHPICV